MRPIDGLSSFSIDRSLRLRFKQTRSSVAVGLLIAYLLPCIASAQVLLHEEAGRFKIENRSAADLLNVSRGMRSIGRLASGETWEQNLFCHNI